MLDPKQQANIDQEIAAAAGALPPLWWALYASMIKEGFTPVQAFELLKVYISACIMRPNPPDCAMPDDEED